MKRVTKYFKSNGQNNRIDGGGNHFVNKKCVNPKEWGGDIGTTYPDDSDVEPAVTVTGYVPHKFVTNRKGERVFVVL